MNHNPPTSRTICILLLAGTFLIYWPGVNNDFINFDDNEYVTENRQLQSGLTLESVRWAFTTASFANWHPVTWMSHMLDFQLYGLNPAGHHFTSLLIHAANVLLLFLLLNRMTGDPWKCAVVSALFAFHPINVESVAWIAERKNVLSTLFWLLTIWAYVLFVGHRSRYLLMVLFFALGLMSKPMLVTLPFVLLLLDFWPLKRWDFDPQAEKSKRGKLTTLVIEKIPLFILAIIASFATYFIQRSDGAVKTLELFSLQARFNNALVSYMEYLGKTLWPTKLSIYYPHPGDSLPLWQGGVCAIILLALTVFVVRMAHRAPYLFVGWFWYLGTLVPVIGLIQVGEQAMADRYAYIPLLGIFIIFAWGLPDLLSGWRHQKTALLALVGTVFPALMILTWIQVAYWKNSITILEHAIEVTDTEHPGFVMVHNNLGVALSDEGKDEEAIDHFKQAIQLKPEFSEAYYSLGVSLSKLSKFEESINPYRQAIRLKPDDADAHYNLGTSLSELKNFDTAISHFKQSIRLKPNMADVHYSLGLALSQQNKFKEAIPHYQRVVSLNPEHAKAHNRLGGALGQIGKMNDALFHFKRALKIQPDFAAAKNNLDLAQSILDR
ncbi:MAG: tetratricopeptide repeat protein [Nitrospina sp.]|nr:tetratricopeptide repeat protein [Nitrospina sp.]